MESIRRNNFKLIINDSKSGYSFRDGVKILMYVSFLITGMFIAATVCFGIISYIDKTSFDFKGIAYFIVLFLISLSFSVFVYIYWRRIKGNCNLVEYVKNHDFSIVHGYEGLMAVDKFSTIMSLKNLFISNGINARDLQINYNCDYEKCNVDVVVEIVGNFKVVVDVNFLSWR